MTKSGLSPLDLATDSIGFWVTGDMENVKFSFFLNGDWNDSSRSWNMIVAGSIESIS